MRSRHTIGGRSETFTWDSGTTGEVLDRVESLIGRIGMNNREQSQAILMGLDAAAVRIRQMDQSESARPLQVQFDALLARLRNDAGKFVRELGGRQALLDLRAAQQPPAEYSWWFLDDWMEQRRKASLKRSLTTLGLFVAGFVVLAVIYQAFLAPDPALIARIGHENSAKAAMQAGDLETARAEIDQGLAIATEDLSLLVLRAVVFEAAGKRDEAASAYEVAQHASETREDFLLVRGDAYVLIGMFDAAMADAEAAAVENPLSPQAYLLAGQIYELRQQYFQALERYEKAAEVADELGHAEYAAIARTRIVFVMQSINLPQILDQTQTP